MSVTKHYRQTPTGDRYTIDFQSTSGGTIEIVATDCPDDPYGNGANVHHRYEHGRICVAEGKEPRTLDAAIAIAAAWMDGYSSYVRTGVFEKKARAYNV